VYVGKKEKKTEFKVKEASEKKLLSKSDGGNEDGHILPYVFPSVWRKQNATILLHRRF